ncbi:hypothetical protein PENARI_c008G11676 [Penicillium arizonense]|uniref:NAD(P)-binding domain-containing protein n=1 Tax=Penicillium arizonense TaxID=1835702 RepID=A0A1F5LK73_PENAI|nr:hypothetical protein PENARI_c008G11676 [Penicillium arizonense]OGE53341.1 hypothetical protein PENARI_c008G11676 [Penicillium arizonense]
MLARSWKVTSVIRSLHQKKNLLELGKSQSGTIDTLEMDLKDIKTPNDASRILESVKPTCVVFAAGSFGDVYAIDRDAAQQIIKASTEAPYITKFLMISFPAARRAAAPWWGKRDIQNWQQETKSYPDIAEAKTQADEYLVAMTKEREARGGPPFQAISLRPSWLLTGPATGRVKLGKTPSLGQVKIADVAAVGVSLLARNDTNGWYDLVEGSDSVDKAVDI